MTTLEVLEKTRDLIRNKEDWFGGNEPCRTKRQYCAWTAIHSAAIGMADPMAAYAILSAKVGNVMFYNDTHTHAEVLELFNIAIAELQGEQCKATTGDQSATTMPPTAIGSTSATTRSLSLA